MKCNKIYKIKRIFNYVVDKNELRNCIGHDLLDCANKSTSVL